MKKYYCVVLIAFIGMISGCAISRKIPYHNLKINLPQIETKNLSIAVWDQRVQLLKGKRKPDFVGYLRSGAGIAYPMGTVSGNDFAEDIACDIASSFKNNGVNCIVIKTNYQESKNVILSNFKKTNNDKLILIKCNQLHTDGYTKENLIYELVVYIYDKDGSLITQKLFSGEKALGSGLDYQKYMPNGLRELIRDIFYNKTINRALNSNSITSTVRVNSNLVNPLQKAEIQQEQSTTKNSENISKNTDVIYLQNGSNIKSKVIEITEHTIKYKDSNNLDGPVRNIPIDNVFMIIYKNGQREIFKK